MKSLNTIWYNKKNHITNESWMILSELHFQLKSPARLSKAHNDITSKSQQFTLY